MSVTFAAGDAFLSRMTRLGSFSIKSLGIFTRKGVMAKTRHNASLRHHDRYECEGG